MANPSTETTKTCKVCGKTKFIIDFPKWLRTCKICHAEENRRNALRYYQEHKDSPEFKAKARAAHKKIVTADRKLYLKKKHETYLRNREWYNSNWHARRAIAAGATEVDRSITISKLMERDKSICGICNLPIIKNPKKHNDKPSIDHIIPIKHGGQHTWANVRLVHCGCNNSRGNRADGSYEVKISFLQESQHSASRQLPRQLPLAGF